MVWIDYFIIAVIALSVLFSLVRGFVKEAISLGTWIAAFWVALTFTDTLARWFTAIDSSTVRIILAFALLFIAILVIGAVINHVVGALVDKTGLSGTDRLIGAVFGFGRGLVVVAALVLVAGWTKLPSTPTWSQSRFLPYVNPVAVWLDGMLPSDFDPGKVGDKTVEAAKPKSKTGS
jgi:membrane protein required for colicin V production